MFLRRDTVRMMAHMHDHGLVHSDLKFANILLQELCHMRFVAVAKVSDLGLAHGERLSLPESFFRGSQMSLLICFVPLVSGICDRMQQRGLAPLSTSQTLPQSQLLATYGMLPVVKCSIQI